MKTIRSIWERLTKQGRVVNHVLFVSIDERLFVVHHDEDTTTRDSCVAHLKERGHKVKIVDYPIKTITYSELLAIFSMTEPKDEDCVGWWPDTGAER